MYEVRKQFTESLRKEKIEKVTLKRRRLIGSKPQDYRAKDLFDEKNGDITFRENDQNQSPSTDSESETFTILQKYKESIEDAWETRSQTELTPLLNSLRIFVSESLSQALHFADSGLFPLILTLMRQMNRDYFSRILEEGALILANTSCWFDSVCNMIVDSDYLEVMKSILMTSPKINPNLLEAFITTISNIMGCSSNKNTQRHKQAISSSGVLRAIEEKARYFGHNDQIKTSLVWMYSNMLRSGENYGHQGADKPVLLMIDIYSQITQKTVDNNNQLIWGLYFYVAGKPNQSQAEISSRINELEETGVLQEIFTYFLKTENQELSGPLLKIYSAYLSTLSSFLPLDTSNTSNSQPNNNVHKYLSGEYVSRLLSLLSSSNPSTVHSVLGVIEGVIGEIGGEVLPYIDVNLFNKLTDLLATVPSSTLEPLLSLLQVIICTLPASEIISFSTQRTSHDPNIISSLMNLLVKSGPQNQALVLEILGSLAQIAQQESLCSLKILIARVMATNIHYSTIESLADFGRPRQSGFEIISNRELQEKANSLLQIVDEIMQEIIPEYY